ncbi:MAG TPA: MscL family protein [Patescibacteria group bacterium]|nr:MscL family protein [Patescibacteria group bacterium]
MKGFVDFIREQGIIGLAIGFVLGGSISKLVTSMVNDLINPLLALGLGRVGELRDIVLRIGSAKVMVGNFLGTLIDFVIIAFVIYFFFKKLKLDRLDKKRV